MARSDTIKMKADRLLRTCKLDSAPINLDAIAAHVGATLSFEPFGEDLSGVCIKEKNRTVIGVNSTHAKTRQRFTIAHEIAHLVLDHKGDVFVDKTVMKRDARSSLAIDQQEIEANGFAAELLMPEQLVNQAIGRHHSKKPDIAPSELVQALADEFQVSPQAMEYRLTNLGMFIPR